jgi:hypothetical protein
LAGASHGVVTRAELLGAGLSAEAIKRRLRSGLLLPEYPGVYRVGHRAPSTEARYLAAVKACGPGALLSGPPAAHLLRLLKGAPPPPEVMAPSVRKIEGVTTRRCRHIDRRDRTEVSGIPVTTVPRTLVDLAAVLALDALARACHEAGVIYRTTPRHVNAVLARRPNSRGARELRAVMGGDVSVTLSYLERAFLKLLKQHSLPLPLTNKIASARRVDCRWPDHKLTVELNSYRFHNSRHSWEQDYEREREARAREDEYRRFTYGDVLEDPAYMLSELRGLLTKEPAQQP